MTKRNRKTKPAPSVPSAPSSWDMGANGPANQDRMIVEPATDIDPETGKETPNPNSVKRRRRVPILVLMLRNRTITDEQATAAARFWMASHGRVEADPLAALNGHAPIRGSSDSQAARVDARREYLAMLARIPLACRPVIDRVVIEDKPVWGTNPATRERHMQRLRTGLDAIA